MEDQSTWNTTMNLLSKPHSTTFYIFGIFICAFMVTVMSSNAEASPKKHYPDTLEQFIKHNYDLDKTHFQAGKASWYGPGFHGRKTASGERFNQHAMTAAHRTLPLGTKVRVTNIDTGKSAIVKINDRGPFVHGRVVDVSYGVAKRLGMVKSGTCNIKIEKL